ncbi:unnamed protein product [Gongylonema pulchrum]|uniref:Uncharacterized protein n=1 Tax=Gongylonema pulchrum TaxID=637853 RepID=A0A3P6QT82_9BILA|nr:unnamed protein product [Gongylonema pulchrum]
MCVRQAFQQAYSILNQIFIRTRDYWPGLCQRFPGSTLSLIIKIPPSLVSYRDWLRGRVISNCSSSPSQFVLERAFFQS